MSDTSSKLDSRLVASGLISAAELAKCRAALEDSADDTRFLEMLQKTNRLTKWQVSQFQAGKYQGFFLDQYKLLEPLGRGGMGSVLRAEDTQTGRVVAVKVLTKKRATGASLRRFRREAEATLKIRHEHLVRTLAFGQHDERHYLVMELVEGTNLAKYVERQKQLSVDVAARVGYEVAQALECAARHGIVHRDVKPQNILLTRDGKAKLADLGLAKYFGDVGSDSHSLTETGCFLGTVDYMSPEQAEDAKRADVRSDIYSLGCTLYHCLTGHVPFPEETSVKKIMAHRELDPRPIADLNPSVPPRFAELVVQRMLAKRPSDRFQTHGEVVSALKIWATGEPDVGSLSVLGDLIDDDCPAGDVCVMPPTRPSRPTHSSDALPRVGPHWARSGPSFRISPTAIGLGVLVLVLLGIVWVLRQPAGPSLATGSARSEGTGQTTDAVPKLPSSNPAVPNLGDRVDDRLSPRRGGSPADLGQLAGGSGPQPGQTTVGTERAGDIRTPTPGPDIGPGGGMPAGAGARPGTSTALRTDGEDRAAESVRQAHQQVHAMLDKYPQDLPGYRVVCSRLIASDAPRVETTAVAAELAWVCALGPGGTSDYSVPLRLAGESFQLNRQSPRVCEYLTAYGAVLFRAGRPGEAQQAFLNAMATNRAGALFGMRDPIRAEAANVPSAGTPYDWAWLAMAEHSLKRPDEARARYQEARRWFDRANRPTPRSNVRVPLNPQQLADLKVLLREAAGRTGMALGAKEVRP
jgi:serine/threonine protein kinase